MKMIKGLFMKTIYFDEAGNTGHDLLNNDQPIYVLSSTVIGKDEAKKILEQSFTSLENLHFKKKKKSNLGKREILDFWDKNISYLNSNFKSMIINKKFMIVCQMMNYLVEPQLHRDGIDYYDEGMNIGHSNMMHMCLPGFCGIGLTNRLYKAFIDMFKIKDRKSVEAFYKLLAILEEKSKSEDFRNDIFILQRSIEEIGETLSIVNKYILDPAMHSLISLLTYWNDELDEEFNVFHDSSNTILNQKTILDFISEIECDEIQIGYGNFKATFPLKMNEFSFIISDNFSIKLCDIVSSSLLYASINDDEFSQDLGERLSEWNLINHISPSTDVGKNPERKKEIGDIDPLDFFAEKMMEQGYE